MKKTCRNCQFLCYQSLPALGIGQTSEPWHWRHDEQTGKRHDALRSWTQKERDTGKVQDSSFPINVGMCFKGIWAANSESEEEQERASFTQSFVKTQMELEPSDERVSEPLPRSDFSLTSQINRSRRDCFWTPYLKGRELSAVELLESRKHSSGERAKTRRVAWLAMLVSVVSVIVACATLFAP